MVLPFPMARLARWRDIRPDVIGRMLRCWVARRTQRRYILRRPRPPGATNGVVRTTTVAWLKGEDGSLLPPERRLGVAPEDSILASATPGGRPNVV